MNWTYTLERLAAPLDDAGGNAHVVQVTSRPRVEDDFINLHFFTNINSHATDVRNGHFNPVLIGLFNVD